MRHGLTGLVCFVVVLTVMLITALPANAQESTTTGTVVSLSRNSLTMTSGPGQYQLYIFGANMRKPDTLRVGSQARIVSTPGNEPGVRVAREITIVPGTAAPADRDNVTSSTVPSEVQRIERDIEREARRYQFGVRGGVALDPELVLIGVQGHIGPLFRSGVFFRPSVDFGLGEVTAMFSLNGDMVYRLPFSSAQDRWSTYVGAGLGVNLVHQSFETNDGDKRIDFGDFHSDTALNVLAGVRRRGGVFMELKSSVYAGPSPTLRMTVGYTF
jgi:hypothetical protein